MEKTKVIALAKALRKAGLPPSLSPDEIRLFIQIWRRLADGLDFCFGYTRKMAWDEIAETGKTEIPNKIKAEIQAGNCACEIKNPSGSCCLGNVHRVVREGIERLKQEPVLDGMKRNVA